MSLLQKKSPRNFPEAITFSSIPLSDHHQPISICYGGSTIGRGSMSIIGSGLTLNINYNEKVNQYDHYIVTNRRGPIRATISAGGLCLTLRLFVFLFQCFFPSKHPNIGFKLILCGAMFPCLVIPQVGCSSKRFPTQVAKVPQYLLMDNIPVVIQISCCCK